MKDAVSFTTLAAMAALLQLGRASNRWHDGSDPKYYSMSYTA